MEIINFDLNNNYTICECIATIGAFDGIHLGHEELFKTLINHANGYKKMVITFHNHPDYLLHKRENEGLLENLNDKIKEFEKYHFDYLVLLTKEVLALDYQSFHKMVLDKLNVKRIVVGEDFKYGLNASGNIKTLQEYQPIICHLLEFDHKKISSQTIRELLKSGKVDQIKKLTGHNYKVKGVVQKGAGLGRKLGFPTANILLSKEDYLMLEGVYACIVTYQEKRYKAIGNVGKNPTVNTQVFPRLEVNIIDYSGDLYDKELEIEFIYLVRKEMKFNSVEELKKTVLENIADVKKGIVL